MRTLSFLAVWACVAGFLPGPSALAAAPLQAVLSADTEILITVSNLPRVVSTWPATSIGRFFADPGLDELLALTGEEKPKAGWISSWVEESTGLSLTELLAPLSGEVAFYAGNVVPALRDGGTGLRWGVGIEVSDEGEMLNGLIRHLLDGDDTPQAHSHGKATMWTVPDDDDVPAWGTVNGRWIMVYPPEDWRDLADRLQNRPGGATLAQSPNFVKTHRVMDAGDLTMYADLSGFADMLHQAAEEDLEAQGMNATEIVDGLGLDTWQSVYFSLGLTREETTMDSGFLYSEDRGLTRVYAYQPGPAPRLGFFPDDVLGAGTARFDLKEAYAALRGVVYEASPMMGLVMETQLQAMTAEVGVNLEEDILEHLGDTSFYAYFTGSGPVGPGGHQLGMDQVAGFSLTNPEAMRRALKTVVETIPKGENDLTVRRAHDATIYELPATDMPAGADLPPTQLAFAVTEEYLVVSMGTHQSLDAILKHMQQPGNSIWERKDIRPLTALIPESASQISYYDGADFALLLFKAWWLGISQETGQSEDASPILKQMSSHFGPIVGHGGKNDDGLVFRAVMKHPR